MLLLPDWLAFWENESKLRLGCAAVKICRPASAVDGSGCTDDGVNARGILNSNFGRTIAVFLD